MSELRDLYQEVIVDHSRHPRNFGPLPSANRRGEGFNPLCGDKITLHLELEAERVKNARFEGAGCAISTASASLMTDAVRGKTVAEAEALFELFHKLVTGAGTPDPEREEELGKLAVFGGVREFPARVKCATLCWHTLRSTLHGDRQPAKTE
jgi:nitrogen fixation NifU-like protein